MIDNEGKLLYILQLEAKGPERIKAVNGVSGKVKQMVQSWWYGRWLGANGHFLKKPAYFHTTVIGRLRVWG